jgi:hypothetical protein
MGAERMAMTWFAGVLLADTGYQPRHRSTRQIGHGIDGIDRTGQDDMSGQGAVPADAADANSSAATTALALAEDQPAQDFPDQLTLGQIRRILEGCALDDPTKVVPELVQLIAHASHTPATLSAAWSEFEEATRDVYALHLRLRDWSALFRCSEVSTEADEDAATLMLSYADDAWRLITLGSSGVSAPAASRATAARSQC